jgi:hypothetical protein
MNAFFIVLGLAAVAVCLYGAVQARLPRNLSPAGYVANTHAIVRYFAGTETELYSAVERSIVAVRHASVTATAERSIYVDVRPDVRRLDDGLGLWARVTVEPSGSGSRYSVTGMKKVKLDGRAERCLVSFERDLRAALRTTTGVRPIDLGGE